MALTKADMAESLFNALGLNKQEARELVDLFFQELEVSLAAGEQKNFLGSEILIFGIKTHAQAETPKPVKKFRFPHDVW